MPNASLLPSLVFHVSIMENQHLSAGTKVSLTRQTNKQTQPNNPAAWIKEKVSSQIPLCNSSKWLRHFMMNPSPGSHMPCKRLDVFSKAFCPCKVFIKDLGLENKGCLYLKWPPSPALLHNQLPWFWVCLLLNTLDTRLLWRWISHLRSNQLPWFSQSAFVPLQDC